MSVQSRTETEQERIERLPCVLRAYASDVERRNLVDCDFGPTLRRAADYIESKERADGIGDVPHLR